MNICYVAIKHDCPFRYKMIWQFTHLAVLLPLNSYLKHMCALQSQVLHNTRVIFTKDVAYINITSMFYYL